MKVFLSWSKTKSQKVAELLNHWIPCVIQSIEPWISSQNIDDGELWYNAIQNQVASIINGIICLTKENKDEPWILFEAGGLAKGLEKSRVYVLLIDLVPDDILLSPLAAFNQTKVTRDGINKLMHVINARTLKPITPTVLDQVFDKFWPDFEEKFNEILESEVVETKSKGTKEDILPSDMQKEILKTLRGLENKVNDLTITQATIDNPSNNVDKNWSNEISKFMTREKETSMIKDPYEKLLEKYIKNKEMR
jgi:hypothetical protein